MKKMGFFEQLSCQNHAVQPGFLGRSARCGLILILSALGSFLPPASRIHMQVPKPELGGGLLLHPPFHMQSTPLPYPLSLRLTF